MYIRCWFGPKVWFLKKKIQWRKKNEIIYKQTVNIRQFSNSLWSDCFLIFLYNQYNNQYNCYKTPDYTGISKVITCTTFSLVGSDTILFQVFLFTRYEVAEIQRYMS